jgi:hypothetical protein
MRRLKFASMGTLCLYLLPALGALSGCGDSVGEAPLSEEAKKADQGVQDGMKAFMQQKSKPKSKSK